MNQILDTIIERYRKYCQERNEAIHQATVEEIAARRSIYIGSRLVTLDPAHLELARMADGLAADGHQIYPLYPRIVTTGLGETVEYVDIAAQNKEWREVYDKWPIIDEFLIYGRDDTAFYIKHLPSGRFQHRGRIGLEMIYFDCATFEECLWEAFKYPLNLDNSELQED